MFEVEPGVYRGIVPPSAWARAVESFDGRGIRNSEHLGEAPWRAAGMLDEDGYLHDAWLEALITVRNSRTSALVISRRDDVEYRVECVCDDRKVVLTTGRGVVEGRQLVGFEPIIEVWCAPVDRTAELVHRTLPPEFAQPKNDGQPIMEKLRVGPDPAQLAHDTDQAVQQLIYELERDPIMRLAEQMNIQVVVMITKGDFNETWWWFSDGETFLRQDRGGTFRVDDGDLRRTLVANLPG